MASVVLRILALVVLFPILFQLGTFVAVVPLVVFNLATGRPLLEASFPISIVQLVVGTAVAVWVSRALWRRMSGGAERSGETPYE